MTFKDSGPTVLRVLEIGIDAMDIPAIRPFWKAVLGYADEVRAGAPVDPDDPLVDPVAQGPAIWFQQMDEPRTERNRLHFDISVPHDEAPRGLAAALAAGGRMLTAEHAPAFLGPRRLRRQRSGHHDLAGPGLARLSNPFLDTILAHPDVVPTTAERAKPLFASARKQQHGGPSCG